MNAATVPASIKQLIANKSNIASSLVEPIQLCVCRKDTSHPVFAGCIDWHSAVHGLWALLAYERAMGKSDTTMLIDKVLDDQLALDHELDYLREHVTFEMPYGRAWFLRLVIEHEKSGRGDRLRHFGDFVLETLVNHYRTELIDPAAKDYDSSAWAIFNMLEYARFIGNASYEDEIENWIRLHFLIMNPQCNYEAEHSGFMATCTNWAWLVSKVLPREEFGPWLKNFLELNGLPSPLTHQTTWHSYGLNFSRAWGLWGLYEATGDEVFADLFAAHFESTYNETNHWNGSYEGVGHWVPQFGMFALQPLFGSSSGR